MPKSLIRIRPAVVIVLFLVSACTGPAADPEMERLQARAQNVSIIRDDFGVPHIYAKTDADAVFGMLYAQSEDDFNRVEQNYVWATGRLAEIGIAVRAPSPA
jgi:acyl-homoserine lactone acylase PvdQ